MPLLPFLGICFCPLMETSFCARPASDLSQGTCPSFGRALRLSQRRSDGAQSRPLVRLVKYRHVSSQLVAEGGGGQDAAREAGSPDPGTKQEDPGAAWLEFLRACVISRNGWSRSVSHPPAESRPPGLHVTRTPMPGLFPCLQVNLDGPPDQPSCWQGSGVTQGGERM